MGYRTDISRRDRTGVIAGVIAIHALLFFAVIHRWGPGGIAQLNDYPPPVSILDLRQPPPPPPPQPRQQAKPKEEEGGSAPTATRGGGGAGRRNPRPLRASAVA